MDTRIAHHAGYPKNRERPNALRDWFDRRPQVMNMTRFAEQLGVTQSYISQLCSDTPPWPGREVARRIGEVTEGAVTPNDLAGLPRRRSRPRGLGGSGMKLTG